MERGFAPLGLSPCCPLILGGYGREASPPLNPPFMPYLSSGASKRGAAPLSKSSPSPSLIPKGKGIQGMGSPLNRGEAPKNPCIILPLF